MKKKYAAPAVSKLFDIIELMSEKNRGFSVNELAKTLQEPVNTVYRICKEMEERGYLNKNIHDGLYYLGGRFYVIGQAAGSRIDLRTQALPHIESLRDRIDETVHLVILRENWMVLLDQAETSQPIRIHVDTGSLLHPHGSAFGKCLLAYRNKEELTVYLSEGLASLTPNTIIEEAMLVDELEAVRRHGWACDEEEYVLGVKCVGAPVFDREGECVAAVGVIAPSYRFESDVMEKAVGLVLYTADCISSALGHGKIISKE